MKRRLLALTVVASLGGCGEVDPEASRAGFEALDDRPATVPPEFVLTPQGWFHPSCVIETAPDERPGDLRRSDCAHPHYDARGRMLREPSAATDGWKAAEWYEASPLYWISASWTVPAAPSQRGSQTLYYFPGLEPDSFDVILQPVLAWNGFGDQAWSLASWNCCAQGNVWHSSAIAVRAGDGIYGQASGSNCNAAGVCSSWSIVSTDTRTNRSTTLNTTTSEAMTWAQGGVLETYGVSNCAMLAGNLSFTQVLVGDVGGTIAPATWDPDLTQASPSCKYGITSTATSGGTSTVTITDVP